MAERQYTVKIKRKVDRGLAKLPLPVQEALFVLVEDLSDSGPLQPRWSNYSKLSDDTYHCHLKHKYVACWRSHGKKDEIEIYYAGSRENAPYDKS